MPPIRGDRGRQLPAARCLLVAIPDAFEGGQVVQQAHAINPELPIIARAHSEEEIDYLRRHGATLVVMGEHEIAKAMLDNVAGWRRWWSTPRPNAHRAAPTGADGDAAASWSRPRSMPHDTPLIATIVVGLVLAFVFGALAHRLQLPPLVGYLLAGVAVGPFTPGFVADQALATELAEIGVILLMFGVGLHFSLEDLLAVRAHRRARRDRADRRSRPLLGMGLAWCWAGRSAPGWCSASRCRSRAPWCCCARCRSGG